MSVISLQSFPFSVVPLSVRDIKLVIIIGEKFGRIVPPEVTSGTVLLVFLLSKRFFFFFLYRQTL